MTNGLSLAEQYEALQIATTALRLNAVDGVWTRFLGSTNEPVGRDSAEIQSVADEMRVQLNQLKVRSPVLQRLVGDHADALNAGMDRALEALGTDEAARVRDQVHRRGGFAVFAQAAIGQVVERADSEIRALDTKKAALGQGRAARGDLDKQTKCGIAGAAAAGCAAAGAYPVAVAICVAAMFYGCFD